MVFADYMRPSIRLAALARLPLQVLRTRASGKAAVTVVLAPGV